LLGATSLTVMVNGWLRHRPYVLSDSQVLLPHLH
jgi:hypothetical protein